jgi:hypothetical protein
MVPAFIFFFTLFSEQEIACGSRCHCDTWLFADSFGRIFLFFNLHLATAFIRGADGDGMVFPLFIATRHPAGFVCTTIQGLATVGSGF